MRHEVVEEDGRRGEVIDGDIEEALDLGGVQIERETRSAPAAVIRLATSLAVIGHASLVLAVLRARSRSKA